MVRIKHRYLLIQLLYPESSFHPQKHSLQRGGTAGIPFMLEFKHAPSWESVEDDAKIHPEDVNELPSIGSLCAPTAEAITIQSLLRLIRTALISRFGDHGSAAAGSGLSIKYWSRATSRVILRCERAAFRLVWAACTSINSMRISGEQHIGTPTGKDASSRSYGEIEVPCVFQVLHVSGTIKKCEEEAVRKNGAICREFRSLRPPSGARPTAHNMISLNDISDTSGQSLTLGLEKAAANSLDQDSMGNSV